MNRRDTKVTKTAARKGRQVAFPTDAALSEFQRIQLTDEQAARIRYGQPVRHRETAQTELGRAYSTSGELVAIVAFDPAADLWRPKKVFASG